MLGEFDPAGLGGAQIGPLADHLATQIGPVDPQAIVGRIADSDVVFSAAFHICADPAEPQQVDLGLEDRGDQAVGINGFGFDPQRFADFLA